MEEETYAEYLEASAKFVSGEMGGQGDCDTCGEWAGELTDGMCAPCREKNKPEVK